MLKTEIPGTIHTDLDQYETPALVSALLDDQTHAVEAARAAANQIAEAVTRAVPGLSAGGRLIYVGAGTSGRLGLLDSVELYPTFSWPREQAIALLAGGSRAVYQAVEGAEDDAQMGEIDMQGLMATKRDVVVALAASGSTPYVLGAVACARAAGALTIGIANNPGAPLLLAADIGITLDTGSELISGSTRLKAGTAQKVVLNTFSSAVMVRMNKVYRNLMVDLKPTNAKLVARAIHLTALATGAEEQVARATLEEAGFEVKVAIVSILNHSSVTDARGVLQSADGNVRQALRKGQT